MPEPRSTGLPGMDAQHDFIRARRRATIAKLMARLRGEPGDVGVVLPYEEVIDALGFVSEHRTGLHVVALDAIVGSVDRGRDFDRRFRPTSGRSRGGGSRSRPPPVAASRSRPSTCCASASCTSSATGTTGFRSRGRSVAPTSTRTSPRS